MEISQRVGEMKFSLYNREDYILVDAVKKFQYIGTTLEETDSDWLAVNQNIRKVQAVWRRLGKLLQLEGLDKWVSALFHSAVIQEVLVFGSESWTLSDTMVRVVEGTHMGFKGKSLVSRHGIKPTVPGKHRWQRRSYGRRGQSRRPSTLVASRQR